MLVEDLESYHQQFLSIKSEAGNLLGNLTEIQLNWQAGSNRQARRVKEEPDFARLPTAVYNERTFL